MDPRNKSEDDCSECVFEDDKRKSELEGDFTLRSLFRGGYFLLSSLRADKRGQAIHELEKKGLISGCLDVFSRKRGMTIMMWILVSSLTMTNMAYCYT